MVKMLRPQRETEIQGLFLIWNSWLLPNSPDHPAVLFHFHQRAILLCSAILYCRNLSQWKANQKQRVPETPVCLHRTLKKMTKRSCNRISAISPQVQPETPVVGFLGTGSSLTQFFSQIAICPKLSQHTVTHHFTPCPVRKFDSSLALLITGVGTSN